MIVKDIIYGNIELNGIYEEIVNCDEFKRLADITQTSMASLEYPALEQETRYEHSIGVYYLMSRTLNELERKLGKQGVYFNKNEKDMAKLAALLHDIGHGVNSHLLEKVTGLSHEERGIDIIRDPNTKIHQIIEQKYGHDFIEQLVEFMEVIYGKGEIKETLQINEDNTISLKGVLAALISHNNDIDRMDYLMRESTYTGLGTFTNYEELIKSLECVLIGDEVLLAIPEDKMYLQESNIFERVRNYMNIYYCDMDSVGNYLFEQLIDELRQHPDEVPQDVPEAIRKFLTQKKMSLTNQEYMQLTNTPFNSALERIKESTQNDKLRYLCDYKQNAKKDYHILPSEKDEDYIRKLLGRVVIGFPKNSKCIFKTTKTIKPYKKTKFGSNNVITKVGIKKFEELQHAISLEPSVKTTMAINPELLRLELGMEKNEFEERYGEAIKEVVESQAKPVQEFERKYIIPLLGKEAIDLNITQPAPFKGISQILTEHYEQKDSVQYFSIDTYYDTKKFDLLKKGASLRIREGNKFYKAKESQEYKRKRITYKTRTDDVQDSYVTKNKSEEIGDSTDIKDYDEFLDRNNISKDLKEVLKVNNMRRLITVLVNGQEIDVSLNLGSYTNCISGKTGELCTIEIRPRENQITGRLGILAVKKVLEQGFKGLDKMASNSDIYRIGMEDQLKQKTSKPIGDEER